MPVLSPVQFQDCQIITKTYKHGCHSCLTRASAFAPLISDLSFIRTMSNTIAKQMESYEESSWKPTSDETEQIVDVKENETVSLGDAVGDTVGSMFTKIGDSFVPGGDFSKILDSDCIPCGVRLKFLEELSLEAVAESIGGELLSIMEAWLDRALSQIRNIIEMFKNLDQYADLCAFFNFFKNFICIPDLYRILAVLSALMMDLSFELNGIIDLAIGLIAPIFVPFLTNILDSLMKYIMLIIKPIECIIDSIQNMLSKLDYNVFFQNIDRIKVGFGPKQGDPSRPVEWGSTIRAKEVEASETLGFKPQLPYFGALSVQDPNFSGEDYRSRAVEFNLDPYQEEDARIRKAEAELEKIRKASVSVDGSDAAAIEKYKEQEKEATEEYNDAVRDRNLSTIGKVNQDLEKFQKGLKSSFLQLVNFLREACLKIDAIFTSLLDEFKKLLGEFVGGTGLYIDFTAKKLAILQIIAFIKAIIEASKEGINCDNEHEEIDAFLSNLPADRNFKLWTDEEGNINIEEDISGIGDAIDEVAKVRNKDFNEADSPMKKLSSLIEYTGDEVLDINISQTAELLTKVSKVTLGCQMLTTVANAKKVNQWIEELSGEQ